MEPVIGIISCGYTGSHQYVPASYLCAVESCGGIPVILPITSDEEFYSSYTQICHGFLFCGGDDINPLLFGEESRTDKGSYDPRTDIFHLSFMKYILNSRLPVLAICRGMQVLNVALGGTIYQDISLRPSPSLNHMQTSKNRSDTCHRITVSPGSMLYPFLQDSVLVNSFHHQSIHVLGQGLKISAIASDGIIEAIETTDHTYTCGVQWHPECMLDSSPDMKYIFNSFINSSKNSKNLHYIFSDNQTY